MRVSRDTPGYLPSENQCEPAIAYNSSTGTSLVVWHDQGRKSEQPDEWGIWGRIWAPTWQLYFPMVMK
ncbi:MAG: hypothetical protein H5T62_10205 [Anaerolineae bacterium]|nr:hypothetical protein [Anaerolineae bacterium]